MKLLYCLAEIILRIVSQTWQIKLINKIPKIPAIIIFWHCDMLPIWKLFSKKDAYTIVSMNKDGEILSHLLFKWKYKLIRGSSSKNGKEVIKEIVNLNKNNYFLITPDGPRGPKYQCKVGAFVIAQRKQVPLYFVKCKIKYKKVFMKSWDNFILPLLFSKIKIEFSERMDIPTEADREYISQLINKINNKFSK